MASNTASAKAAQAAIKAMRGEGLSQADIAARVGTTQATVSRWERGTSSPSPVYVKNLAKTAPPEHGQLLAALNATVTSTLEDRVAALEADIAQIKALLQPKGG